MLKGDHHQALRCEYRAIHSSSQEVAKLHLQPCEQDQPKGVSWQYVERDGKDKACRGPEISVGRVFHSQR